jgi:outer membrane protein assembly factor BamB
MAGLVARCSGPSDNNYYLAGITSNGHVHCLDARNGNLIWQRRLEKQYEIDVLRCRPSPLIDGNRLILQVGGKPGACVIALDKHSGKEVWEALDDSVSNSSPVIVEAAGKRPARWRVSGRGG